MFHLNTKGNLSPVMSWLNEWPVFHFVSYQKGVEGDHSCSTLTLSGTGFVVRNKQHTCRAPECKDQGHGIQAHKESLQGIPQL